MIYIRDIRIYGESGELYLDVNGILPEQAAIQTADRKPTKHKTNYSEPQILKSMIIINEHERIIVTLHKNEEHLLVLAEEINRHEAQQRDYILSEFVFGRGIWFFDSFEIPIQNHKRTNSY